MIGSAINSIMTRSLDQSDSIEHRYYKIGKFTLIVVLSFLFALKLNSISFDPDHIFHFSGKIKSLKNISTFIVLIIVIVVWLIPLYIFILNSIAHSFSVAMRKAFKDFPKLLPIEQRKPVELENLPFLLRKFLLRLVNLDIIRLSNDRIVGGALLPKFEFFLIKAKENEEDFPINEIVDKLLSYTMLIIVISFLQYVVPMNTYLFVALIIALALSSLYCIIQYISLKIIIWNIHRIFEWVESLKYSNNEHLKSYLLTHPNGFQKTTCSMDQITNIALENVDAEE